MIILGNTRSGTSILQRSLSRHPDLVGWYEPRTLWQVADPGRRHDEYDAGDATPRVQRYVRRRFLRFQEEHGGSTVVEKTPANILRVPYVREIFPDATYLAIVRDPFAFLSSVERKWQKPVTARGAWRRLGETPPTQVHHYARKYARQLWDKHVSGSEYLSVWGPRYRGIQDDLRHHDQLTVIARQWAIPSRLAAEALAAFPDDQLLCLRYEDFVQDPIAHLERVTQHCGLEMTDEMATAADRKVDPSRMDKWRRFDPADLARLLPELLPEMQRHRYAVPDEVRAAAVELGVAWDLSTPPTQPVGNVRH
ncbi:sulfotransferase family protein [Salsipaludibacter albus]|uniref:sulfotransferase family protein n=1 Tax=Salsipaludibacter albus TaxID=2849650 RepID=UPI001EE45D0F|nr:sulfotransferase [Salsipaludibacter albus]